MYHLNSGKSTEWIVKRGVADIFVGVPMLDGLSLFLVPRSDAIMGQKALVALRKGMY